MSFGVVRAGGSLVASVTGEDQTGPGEALAGSVTSKVEISTDLRTFHPVSSSDATPLRAPVELPPGARIWIRGST